MGKPTICLGENKGADQLRSNCEADQRLCFRYSDSAVPLLLKSEISSFYLFSVTVQVGLCRTWSETTLLVFPRDGSYVLSCIFAKNNSNGYLSRLMGKPTMWFLNRSDTNRAVQSQKTARDRKFWI